MVRTHLIHSVVVWINRCFICNYLAPSERSSDWRSNDRPTFNRDSDRGFGDRGRFERDGGGGGGRFGPRRDDRNGGFTRGGGGPRDDLPSEKSKLCLRDLIYI